jgi:FkbH-like protein
MPACYQTCDLYMPRKDGNCRRFATALTCVANPNALFKHIVGVSFKKWGQLMAFGNLHLVPVNTATRLVETSRLMDSVAAAVPDGSISIAGRRGISTRLVRRYKQWMTHSGTFARGSTVPDYFVIEVYNPGQSNVAVTLTIFSPTVEGRKFPFQRRLDIRPGFNRMKVDFQEIAKHIDATREIHLSLNPNIIDADQEGSVLYFGLATFVRDASYVKPVESVPARASGKVKHVKVMAWDLDNTIWDGVLIESGAEGVRLRPGVADVIKELDRRGIVNSVVSKNNEAEAMEQLRVVGLADYMVFPKINWGPKSASIGQLIEDFNVGADTVAFIDDSEFERAQVIASLPQVRVYPHTDYADLLAKPEFDPPVSAESSRRRQFYRNQGERRTAEETFVGEYEEFLRQCTIELRVDASPIADIGRVHELVQRTNQMNMSGSRYSRDELKALLDRPEINHFCLSAVDRFGDYGMIGFCLVDNRTPRVIDLMFSCRIQSKRVEHAFLEHLMAHYAAKGRETLQVRYVRSPRNEQVGAVFRDLAFTEFESNGNETIYAMDLMKRPRPSDIIAVTWTE